MATSPFKGTNSPAVAVGLRLVASGVSIRNAAKLAGCSSGGLAKAIARKRKEIEMSGNFPSPPVGICYPSGVGQYVPNTSQLPNITVRDYFAAKALAGFLSNPNINPLRLSARDNADIVDAVMFFADAMLEVGAA